MGQQQLLLLVLGIVIVGLAVVVGIEAFNENKSNSTVDAMVNDIVRIGSDFQAWSLKPQAFGGPSEGEGFTNVSLERVGYTTAVLEGTPSYSTMTGTYAIYQASETTADCVIVLGYSNNAISGGTIDTENAAVVAIRISGPDPEDIQTGLGDDAFELSCS